MSRCLAIILSAACGSLVQASDDGCEIERWNAEFLQAIRRQAPPPCLVARNLAMFHLAIWNAIDAAQGKGEACAAKGAAHEVAVKMFPGDRAGFDSLLKAMPAEDVDLAEEGRSKARLILTAREHDGASTTIHYDPFLKAGVWHRTTRNRQPEMPHWSMVKPFALNSSDQFRPPPPPSLTSQEYADQVAEVRELGGKLSNKRSGEQELIARFWADFSYTSSPPGRWNEIACASMKSVDLDLYQKALLLAVLNLSLADSSIAAWDCKYHYRFWRPVDAIRETLNDGNHVTVPDKKWKSLLPCPSHPEYVSGHSVFSGAAAEILASFIPNPKLPIHVSSVDTPGVVRSYQSFDEIAREIARSRVYGGIHFTFSGDQGLILGKNVAKEVFRPFRDRVKTVR